MLAVLSFGGAVAVLGTAARARRGVAALARGQRCAARRGGALRDRDGAAVGPAVPAAGFLPPTSSALTSDTAKGNLIEPLSALQLFGIWPAGDFRLRPGRHGRHQVLIAVVALRGAARALVGVAAPGWGLLAYVGTARLGCLVIAALGSPWVDAKALATASPALLFAALVGAGDVSASGRRVEARGGRAGDRRRSGVVERARLPGRQPGAHATARGARADRRAVRRRGTGADDRVRALRRPALPARGRPRGRLGAAARLRPAAQRASTLEKLRAADIDEFALAGILPFRTLVLRRSPAASRPPAPYRRIERGRWYDVWQRPASGHPRVLEHVSLGDRLQPVAEPSCDTVQRLAERAGSGAAS